MGQRVGACTDSSDPLGSVEELQLETRVTRSPGLEVEVELAAPLALGRSVGDDDLDRVIVQLVGNAAPAGGRSPVGRRGELDRGVQRADPGRDQFQQGGGRLEPLREAVAAACGARLPWLGFEDPRLVAGPRLPGAETGGSRRTLGTPEWCVSTLLRSGPMGRGSISKRRWRNDRKRRKLARDKRKHEQQSALQPRRR